jgi:ABC-2 type transport system permease protein
MITRLLAVVRHQTVLLRRTPGPVISYALMPPMIILLLAPIRAQLAPPGGSAIGATAAAALVMFSLFMAGVIAAGAVNERAWRTADRLRSTPVRGAELLAGRSLPLIAVLLAQQAVVFGFARAGYGPDLGAHWAALTGVGLCWAVCVLGCGTLLGVLVRSQAQLGVAKDVGALGLSGLGGTLVPVGVLPPWARSVAPFSPAYWAMRAYQGVLGAGAPGTALAVAVLLVVGLATFLAAVALAAAARSRSS